MADKAAERIKYQTERLRLLYLLALAIGGGSLSLLLGPVTRLRVGLALLGLLATVVLTAMIWRQDRRILTLIEALTTEAV